MGTNQPSIIDNTYMKYIKNYSPSKFSSSIAQEKTHYIIFTSHSEFQEIPNDQINNELTQIGIEQAMDIGFQLKLNLLGINFSEINIFSSPFIHNIQTLLYIINIIDYENTSNKILYINKNLADIYDLFFDSNKIQNLLSKDLYKRIIAPLYKGKKYSFNNKFFNEMKNVINKDETKEDIINRFNEIIELIYQYIINKYSKLNNNSLNIIYIPKEYLKVILSKFIAIINNDTENKINIDLELNQEINSSLTYCFKMPFSQQKIYKYLGKLIPDKTEIDKNLNDIKKENNRFIAVMRHGERIDNTDFSPKQELPEFDPELTYEGMKQAINIGIQLRNYFIKENYDINAINIFNSPSTRCLQTGLISAGAVDYSDKIEKVIKIITDLNETSVKGGFENNKEESPIYYHKDKDKNLKKLYDKYITKLIKDRKYRYEIFDFDSILIGPPEELKDVKKRSDNVINNIKDFSKKNFNKGNNTLNIVSSHQLNISMIVGYLIKELNKEIKNKGGKEIQMEKQSFGYNHCFLFKYDENDNFKFVGLFTPDVYECFEFNINKFNLQDS